jgi:dynactin complex subunit
MAKHDESQKDDPKLDKILKEIESLRTDIKTLKMNILQINQLKAVGGGRV